MESSDQMVVRAKDIFNRSKRLLAFTIMTVTAATLASNLKAQTFSEWFKQKSTQKKYLLQQIAALQVYAAYYKAGNSIAHNGFGLITGSLKSEIGLHTTYYSKLKSVNPVVKNNNQVSDIMQWQKDILTRMGNLENTRNLTDEEKKYIIQVKVALYNDCNAQITELQNVLTDSKLLMSDEERLNQIGFIHTAMQSNYRFASTFSDQVKVYEIQRGQENNSVITQKKINGIIK